MGGGNVVAVSRAALDKDPRDVASMFDGVARRYDVTNTVLVLRALNATWERIDDLADLEDQQRRTVVPGALFDEVATAAEPARRQVEITPTGAQLAKIDPLVTATRARDRSHLCALALRAFLGAGFRPVCSEVLITA